MYAVVVNCVIVWCIDCILIKSLNFLSGRRIERRCASQGSSHAIDTFNCNKHEDDQCSQTCSLQTCEQTCNNAKCDPPIAGTFLPSTCNAQDSCSLKCDQGECVQECNGHECGLECNGELCRQICKMGTCSLKCNNNKCEQTCYPEFPDQHCSELTVEGTSEVHCSVSVHWSKESLTITETLTRISEHYHTSTGE